MNVTSVNPYTPSYNYRPAVDPINNLVSQLGQNVTMPDATRNYSIFNYALVNQIVAYREQAVPYVANFLNRANDEKSVSEGIYVLDRMIDSGVKGIEKSYPALSRFNNTTSPTIQTMLAGIYRKTQVPDGFGPLCTMLIRNSIQPNSPYFDPNEEIGGAILDYLRNKGAVKQYSG